MSDRALDIAIQARLASDMDGAVLSVRRLLEVEAAAPSLTVERLAEAMCDNPHGCYDWGVHILQAKAVLKRLTALTPSSEEPVRG